MVVLTGVGSGGDGTVVVVVYEATAILSVAAETIIFWFVDHYCPFSNF